MAVAEQPPQPEQPPWLEQLPRLEPGPAVRKQLLPVKKCSVQLEPCGAGCRPEGVGEQPVQVEEPGQSGGWPGPQRVPPDELDDVAAQHRVATERPLLRVAPALVFLQENPASLAVHWWSQIEMEMSSRRIQHDGK
jgi:hypothetical protein